jgi:hypothetical protein
MTTHRYYLTCSLEMDPARFVAISNKLETSLPCVNCRRDYRTVIFEGKEKDGICTPREKCSGFHGRVVERKIDRLTHHVEILYTIEFDYEPFKDEQLGKETVLGKYGWARIYFSAICASCGEEGLFSTQENMIRPYTHKCSCGTTVMLEEESPFRYAIAPKQDG